MSQHKVTACYQVEMTKAFLWDKDDGASAPVESGVTFSSECKLVPDGWFFFIFGCFSFMFF